MIIYNTQRVNYAYMIRQCLLVTFLWVCADYVYSMETGFQFLCQFYLYVRMFASKLSKSGCIYTLKKGKQKERLNGIYNHRVLRNEPWNLKALGKQKPYINVRWIANLDIMFIKEITKTLIHRQNKIYDVKDSSAFASEHHCNKPIRS